MAFDGSTITAAETGLFVAGEFTDAFSLTSTIDIDVVALTLEAGTGYQIDVDHGTASDLYLRIFDMFGNEVRANDDGFRSVDDVVFSLSPYVDFTPNYSGVYYIAISPYYLQGYDPFTTLGRVSPENPIGTTPGTLTVTSFEPNSFPSANAINAIASESGSDETDAFRDEDGSHRVVYSGGIESASDVDISRIDLTKGDMIVVDVNGLDGNGTVLRAFNAAGTQIGLDDDSGFGEDPEFVFVAASGGTHYFAISGEGNSVYNANDGTGTVAGAVGEFEVIVHRNPTTVGTSGVNSISGNSQQNYIVALAGNDTVNGNDGDDTLAGGDDQDSLLGGNGLDVLYGEQGNDRLFGGNGRDVLVGGLGDDMLDGGKGNDLMEGGTGNDSLSSGLGITADTLRGDDGNDVLVGGKGGDLLSGGAGDDDLFGDNGQDTLDGGTGNDILNGGGNDDTVTGGTGNDNLLGDVGADLLDGGDGNDSLSGEGGDDVLTASLGNDTMNGGAGLDTFDFNLVPQGFHLIEDFTLTKDKIDLSTIFLATASVVTAGNLAQFVQITPAGAGADSFLAIDANGAVGGLSFTIVAQVNGLTSVQLFDANNFIL